MIESTHTRHEHGKPCPITGKAIPHGLIVTDHSRPGCYNACGACTDDSRTLAERLRDLDTARAEGDAVR